MTKKKCLACERLNEAQYYAYGFGPPLECEKHLLESLEKENQKSKGESQDDQTHKNINKTM